jgi:cytochrome P450
VNRLSPFAMPREWGELRATAPVARAMLPTGREAWLITRYDLVRQILADPRVTANRMHPNWPTHLVLPPGGRERGVAFTKALIGADPPEHTERRRMLDPEFAFRRVRTMAPRIQQFVDARIDQMLAGPRPTDLVKALALPVPSMVICELLGVPAAGRDYFHERVTLIVGRDTEPDMRLRAIEELHAFLDGLVTEKEQEPADDLLSRLIEQNAQASVFDHEMLTGIAIQMLLAGHGTVTNMISVGIVTLLENPKQLAALKADPGLLDGAIEELLRYLSLVEAGFRVAREDIELGGVTIKAGDGLIALSGAANRDEAAFPAPDTLDLRRSGREHVAFGHGPHGCLGQNLARLELRIVFGALLRRAPGLRLAVPFDELPFKDDTNLYRLYELPVTW